MIQNEITRRVGAPTVELARFLGIEPDTDPGEPDDALKLPPRDHPPMNESRVIRGPLPFEITATCMGRPTRQLNPSVVENPIHNLDVVLGLVDDPDPMCTYTGHEILQLSNQNRDHSTGGSRKIVRPRHQQHRSVA